jgi:hypothetical protein
MLSPLKRLASRKISKKRAQRQRGLRRSLEQLEQRQLLAADLDFSAFFPSTAWADGAYEVAQDSSGNAYISTSSYDPVTNDYESAISKLSPTGDLLWTQELDDYAWDIAVDDAGYVYFASVTLSDDLPITGDAFQSARAGGYDLYVGILDGNAIDGNPGVLAADELVYASYLGGSTDDYFSFGNIATDGDGGIYVVSTSLSSDFPTTSQPSVDSTLDGVRNGVLSYFARDAETGEYSLHLSTYLGGSGTSSATSVAVDSSGLIHVAGGTEADDFVVTANAYQATNEAGGGFLALLTSDGELVYGSYFPAGAQDIAVDTEGNTYMVGYTSSRGFPITEGAYAPPEIDTDQFAGITNANWISKISTSGELEHPSWYQLSREVKRLYWTSVTVDGNRPVVTGTDVSRSAHVLRFAEDFSGLLEHVVYNSETEPNTGEWVSPSNVVNGSVYVVGFTNSDSFETTPGAIHPTKSAGNDGYVKRYTFGELLPPTISRDTVTVNPTIAAGAEFAVMRGLASSSSHTLSYAITAGNVGNAFSIDAAGKITLHDPNALDFETYQATDLTITVTDNQSPPQSNSATLTIQPYQPVVLAEDSFDSRRFDRGEGWIESEWQRTNYTYIVDGYNDDGHNYAGTMLQNDQGLLQRSLDTSAHQTLRLSYWTKLKSLESGDRGLVQVSSDGVNWQTIRSHENGEDDDTWRFQEIEFSTPGDRTYIRFDAAMSQSGRWWRPNHDYWYVDEIQVEGVILNDREPIGLRDAFVVDQGQTLVVSGAGVLANDVDPDGDAISAALVSSTSNGSLALNASGGFEYTPNVGFSGLDSFEYQVTDGVNSTSPITVSIEVVSTSTNLPPAAADDGETTAQDFSVLVDVLANDSDPDDDAITIDSITQPSFGSAAIIGERLQYTPNANFHGSDNFTYTIVDTSGNIASATVNVTVTAVNDAPVGNGENLSGNPFMP